MRYANGPLCQRCESRGGVKQFPDGAFHPHCERVTNGKPFLGGPTTFIRRRKAEFEVILNRKKIGSCPTRAEAVMLLEAKR